MTTDHETANPSRLSRILAGIPEVLARIFMIYIGVTLVLNVVVAPFVDFHYKWLLNDLGWLFIILGTALGVILALIVRKMKRPSLSSAPSLFKRHGFAIFVAVGAVALIILQVIIVWGCHFIGDAWDGPLMIWQTDLSWINDYYSIYPNNLFLGGAFAMTRDALGGTYTPHLMRVLCYAGCASATASVCMSAFIARRIANTSCGVCVFLLSFVFVGLNPHFLVPYSDIYSLVFTTSILCLYTCCRRPWIAWPLIVLITIIGCSLKPTIAIVIVAIVIVEALQGCSRLLSRSPSNEDPTDPKAARSLSAKALPALRTIALCVVALILGGALTSAVSARTHAHIDSDRSLNPAHYLMIGANDEDGTYTNADRSFSEQWPDQATRTRMDLQETLRRYERKGIGGTIAHLVRKNLVNYDNGDMWWYRPTWMFMYIVHGQNEPLQQFYGIEQGVDTGAGIDATMKAATPSPWSWMAQGLWFMILMGIVMLLFSKRRSKEVWVMTITLLGLSLFVLFFEAGARYLFLYSPYYVILGVMGWQSASRFYESKRMSKASR